MVVGKVSAAKLGGAKFGDIPRLAIKYYGIAFQLRYA